MINLQVHNALDRCIAFDEELDIRRVSKIVIKKKAIRAVMQQNLDELNKTQGNEELKKALQKALDRPMWVIKSKKALKKNLRRIKGLVS